MLHQRRPRPCPKAGLVQSYKAMMHLRLRNRLLMAAPLLAVLACGGDDLLLPPGGSPTATDPGQLQMAAGDNQTGTAGSALPEPVLVQLVDSAGRGIADQPV